MKLRFDDPPENKRALSMASYVLRILRQRYPGFSNHLDKLERKDEESGVQEAYAYKTLLMSDWSNMLGLYSEPTIHAALGQTHQSHPDRAPSLNDFRTVCQQIEQQRYSPVSNPQSTSYVHDLRKNVADLERIWLFTGLEGDAKFDAWKAWHTEAGWLETVEKRLAAGQSLETIIGH